MTNSSGTVIETTNYEPFGGTRAHTGTTTSNYKFTDQELDAENGLYNYDARLYDPVLGRFISADTLVPEPYNPQSLNRYSYCLNNPLIYTDPSGYWWGSDLWNSFTNWFQDTFSQQTVTFDDTIIQNSSNEFTLGETTITAQRSSVFAYSTTEGFSSIDNAWGADRVSNNIVRMPIEKPHNISLRYDGKYLYYHTDGKVYGLTAVSGDSKNPRAPEGIYKCSRLQERTKKGMEYPGEKKGWSLDMNPTFNTDRKWLRIHPDGGTIGYTEGCIGVSSIWGAKMLYNDFKDYFHNGGDPIKLEVNY